MFSKSIKLLFICFLLQQGFMNIHAEEPGDGEYVPLDVSIPTEILITFNEDGTNNIPDNLTIQNNSDIGGVKITGIDIIGNDNWQLMSMGFDQTKFPVNSRQVKMQLSAGNSRKYDLFSIDKMMINDMLVDPLSSIRLNMDIWRAAYSFESKEKAFDMVMTIDWEKEPAIIRFDTAGGSSVDKIITIQDQLDLSQYKPTRNEHVFLGWYDADDPKEDILPEKFPISGNTTLKAKWQINQYTTTFDTAGGTDIQANKLDYGSVIDLNSVSTSRTGYTFDGWYLDDQQLSGSYTIESDKTLIAHWTANEYNVVFDSAGGSAVPSVTTAYDQDLILPEPTRTGYTFNGWYTQPNGAGIKVENGIYQTASDQKLYASWTINQYTLAFNAAGGTAVNPITKDYGSVINLNSYVPSRTGYTFNGWYAGSSKVSGNYTLTSDISLNASWTANKYTMNFNTVGGSAVAAKTVTYDQAIGSLPTTNKKGWHFDGWLVNGNYISALSTYGYASNTTATAHWSNQAPVFTYAPTIYNTMQEIGVETKWYNVYRSLIISDREDGTMTSSANYNDVSFSTDTASSLWDGLYVTQVTAPSGETKGDGINNAYGGGGERMEAFIYRNGKGTYKVKYSTQDSLGVKAYVTRSWVIN